MAERQLNDQWVEELDGKKHMLKAVEAINKGHVCNGCAFNNGTCDYKGDECPVPKGCYIKDLGILNEDGCLPCPFCGEYPVFAQSEYKNWELHCDAEKHLAFSGIFLIRQQAVDAWNRRA